MGDVTQALERRAMPKEHRTIYDLIDRQRPAIERALPNAIGAERFARIVMTEVRRVPALLECSPESLLGALMLSAQLGLEPGPLGHVYFVPFKKQVTFIVGYRGMIDLARRSEKLSGIRAATVYEGDGFDYEERARGPYLVHREASPDERGEVVCYYGHATIVRGTPLVKRLWPSDVEAARKRSPAARSGSGPWLTDFEAMAWKTCVRRMAPWLPMTVQAGRAIEVDESPVIELADGEVQTKTVEEDSSESG